jgi:putative transposase
MPFQETRVMDQRQRFVQDAHCSLMSFSELCRRYGISRKTGYKWLERWIREGPHGLRDRSSRPIESPLATPPTVVEAILEVRRKHTDYGAKKVTWYLERNRPDLRLPSRTTIHNILHRHGLIPARRRRVRRWHPGRPNTEATHPNAIWTTDFKGQFRTRDGRYCFPLTVQDMYSRFLLGCQGRLDISIARAKPVFARLFREFGMPERIRSDNGAPFASNALGRLSQLSVWFIRLGIIPELIEPASPQQNGKHENMHLVLKRQATRPPQANLRMQQRALTTFRHEYNWVRPHEALDGALPSDLYRPSARPFPRRLEPLVYPAHFEVRLVSRNGGIRWLNQWVNVSHLLAEEYVGLEEVDAGLFDVYFGSVWLGRFVEPKLRIVDGEGRTKRRQGGNHKRTVAVT